MSRKRKRGAKATAASMVMDTLKKRGAVDEKSAVDVSVFKNLPYATSTISYTISNLMEEGVVGKTNDERFYYDDLGFKALETKFVRGYSMIFLCLLSLQSLFMFYKKYYKRVSQQCDIFCKEGDLNGEAKIVCVYHFLFNDLSSFCGRK